MNCPAISVLTTTWNRAHVLHRVYESLTRQQTRDFEWAVVDDGSTDDTPSLLSRWQEEADFPISWYRYSNNRGRNAALNAGRSLVSGDYTLILDSDDALLENALEMIPCWRKATGIDANNSVCALRFLYVDETGMVLGKRKPPGSHQPDNRTTERIVTAGKEAFYRLGINFDCVVVLKTDIFQGVEFVELTNSEHCPESVTIGSLSNRYKMIYVNRPLACCIRDRNEPGWKSRMAHVTS